MVVRPIKTEKDHSRALREIEKLWGAKVGTSDGDRLDVLMTLVDAYERVHHVIDTPDPLDAIRFRLEQMGADLSSLIGVIGSRTRVYEVMRGSRPLSLLMIRRLNKQFQIPADALIATPRPPRAAKPRRSKSQGSRTRRQPAS
jgi:HTH-type transcriptional regulator/antitoxin HigA